MDTVAAIKSLSCCPPQQRQSRSCFFSSGRDTEAPGIVRAFRSSRRAGEAQLVLPLCVGASTNGGRAQAALGRTFHVRAVQDPPSLWGWAMPRLSVPGVPLRGFGWAAWAGHSNLSQHWGRRGASSHAVNHLQNPGSSGLPLKHWFISFFSTQWGSWTSHISQTKGGLRGTKVGSLPDFVWGESG